MSDSTKIYKLFKNNNYIVWLEDFTARYFLFFDDDWVYKADEYSRKDIQNIKLLSYFFKGISMYADKHSIPAGHDKAAFSNIYYYLRYRGITYKISTVVGQGAVTYCKRVDGRFKNVMDFNDVADYIKSS